MTPGDVVVVVGVGPGLGVAIARAFAVAGGRVVTMARDPDRLAELTEPIEDALAVPVDVSDESAFRQAFGDVRKHAGDPAVLVHNPSAALEATALATPVSALMGGFALAAGSLLTAAQEVAPAMRRRGGGSILVTGSSAALTGSTWSASLAAQKAAARNLAFSLAKELAADKIGVTTITIDGILGTPGFETDRIAAEYVRIAAQTTRLPPADPEVVWSG